MKTHILAGLNRCCVKERKITLYLLLVGLLCAHDGYTQRADRKIIKQLQADIGYLASDDLEGRRTGSDGEHKAAAYIEKRYVAEGIGPYKDKYIYPFSFVYGKEIAAVTKIRMGNIVLKPDEAFPLPFSASRHVYSEILPDVLEGGSIWMMALYSSKEEAENPHFDWEKVMYDRCREAIAQGASGVLFYDSYDARYPPEFNKLSQTEKLDIPVAFLTYKAYAKYMQNDKYEVLAKDNGNGIPVDINIQLKKADRVGNNVAAYIDNHQPYTVVIGAHYDHLGRGEDGNVLYTGKDKQVYNGADDNASGTAALLQVAGWIKKHKLRHYNYLFVNFSGEELGLLGSKAFIKDQGLDSLHIAYMINMDMVGRLNDSTHALTLGGVGTSPVWGGVINKQNKAFRLNIDSSGIGPSDHTSFYLAHIPVLFFFTGAHKDYHKPTDDADKINYAGEAKVIHYVYSIVAAMDRQPKPAFTRTKETSLGKVSFKVTLGIMPDYAYTGNGVRVDAVSDGRPAMRAGIKEGDVIIQLGNHEVKSLQSYMEALSKFNKGDKTTVTVLRSGLKLTLPVQFDR